jgi:hypothetical protein
MTKSVLQGNWMDQMGKLNQKYDNLTFDDLTYAQCIKNTLPKRFYLKLWKSKEELEIILNGIKIKN